MRRVTSGWTERHLAVASLLTVSVGCSMAGLLDGGWVSLVVAVAVLLTVVPALLLDAWGGAVVGLLAVGALVAVRRHGGGWTQADFVPAVVEACGILVAGTVAGGTGTLLSRGTAPASTTSVWQPAYGSLGLLGADAAMARLEEECARSARLGRPLTLALLDVDIHAADLSDEGRDAARRTVARLVEHHAGEHDIPFALSADRLGIIFPESAATAAWDAIGAVLAGTATAGYTYGQQRSARSLAEVAEVHVGIAQYAPRRDSWQTLLDAAVHALQRARDDGEVPA